MTGDNFDVISQVAARMLAVGCSREQLGRTLVQAGLSTLAEQDGWHAVAAELQRAARAA
jgi:hypothetical protein